MNNEDLIMFSNTHVKLSFVQPGVDTPSKSPNFLLYSQILFLLVLYSVKMHHLTSLSFISGTAPPGTTVSPT